MPGGLPGVNEWNQVNPKPVQSDGVPSAVEICCLAEVSQTTPTAIVMAQEPSNWFVTQQNQRVAARLNDLAQDGGPAARVGQLGRHRWNRRTRQAAALQGR